MAGMLAAIHQPQFLPWEGYFDKMDQAEVFVLLDDVQFKKNEWQNRNRIKGPNGPQWLTVPVHYRLPQTMREVTADESSGWRETHLKSLRAAYGRAPHFGWVFPALERAYGEARGSIAEVNGALLEALRGLLGIRTPMRRSSELASSGSKSERLVSILRVVGADAYLSGAGALDYLEPALFAAAGIRVLVQEFTPSPHPQSFGDYVPSLSVADLLMHEGPNALERIRAGRRPPRPFVPAA